MKFFVITNTQTIQSAMWLDCCYWPIFGPEWAKKKSIRKHCVREVYEHSKQATIVQWKSLQSSSYNTLMQERWKKKTCLKLVKILTELQIISKQVEYYFYWNFCKILVQIGRVEYLWAWIEYKFKSMLWVHAFFFKISPKSRNFDKIA